MKNVDALARWCTDRLLQEADHEAQAFGLLSAADNEHSIGVCSPTTIGSGSLVRGGQSAPLVFVGSYKELPPTGVPNSKRLTTAHAGTKLHTIRQLELSAMVSDTGTPLTSFNKTYQLRLYYSPREIGPIIGGNDNVQLHRWDGSGWQQVGSTYGSDSENLLYISADLTGRFAILGPTNQILLAHYREVKRQVNKRLHSHGQD